MPFVLVFGFAIYYAIYKIHLGVDVSTYYALVRVDKIKELVAPNDDETVRDALEYFEEELIKLESVQGKCFSPKDLILLLSREMQRAAFVDDKDHDKIINVLWDIVEKEFKEKRLIS